MTVETVERTIPIVEIFGPTVQGEGILAGTPTYFVRVGLCDYRCSWCDSMHAVLPEEVKERAEKLTPVEVADRLGHTTSEKWVTLSGGNPAVHDLLGLVEELHGHGFKVAVETQGSYWRDWLLHVDSMVVSPKPPSSGMVNDRHDRQLRSFMLRARSPRSYSDCMKIVVFDEVDLAWAIGTGMMWPEWPLFLSVGTDRPDPDEPIEVTRGKVCDRYRWLCEEVTSRGLDGVRVLPQLHVLSWGHALGR